MTDIAANLRDVSAKIEAAAARAGRRADEVTLIAVTKLHDPEEIAEAIACGVTDIAENKVQEILKKYPLVDATVNWHLIGHLQTNKVRQIVDKVSLIHSVDSLHLAIEIDKRCAALGKTMDILVQVNIAGEEQKSGVSPEATAALVSDILLNCRHVRICGLMCMAPYAEDPETVRPYFRQAKALFDELHSSVHHERASFTILSMGMSGDFEVAVEEGATMVRIGTAIFGARDYSKTI